MTLPQALTTVAPPADTTVAPDVPRVPMTLAPERELGGTRSSYRWEQLPGNFDKLNCRALWRSGNEWGIPDLPPAECVPNRLVAYTARKQIMYAKPGAAIHFFLDDYRFETMWNHPDRGLSRCQALGIALTPDFSLWPDMPPAMQLWQVYRNRWCGAWLLHHGVRIVPTISWSTPPSYLYAFAGVTPGSVVAVSTVGAVRDLGARTLFYQGFTEMVRRLSPAAVLVYGRLLDGMDTTGVTIHSYPTRWDED
jgi:Domain of unknown function (DUF4417)